MPAATRTLAAATPKEAATAAAAAAAWPSYAFGAYKQARAVLPPPPAVYDPARVAVQDAVVAACLAGVVGGRARPWLVFTCGAMGAGKSHTLRALAGAGAFPLLSAGAAVADPDLIKQALPELAALVAAEPRTAHTRVHAESGYLSDIVAREALTSRAHLIVDGTRSTTLRILPPRAPNFPPTAWPSCTSLRRVRLFSHALHVALPLQVALSPQKRWMTLWRAAPAPSSS